MRVLALLLITSLSTWLAADEWLATFGPVDDAVILADRSLVQSTGLHVTKVEPRGPAGKAGLAVGDIVVGLRGLRLYGEGEYAMIRYEYGDDSEPAVLSVLRGDEVIHLTIAPWRYRTFAFSFSKSDAVTSVLSAAGITIDRHQDPLGYRAWLQFPKRELSALQRWLGTNRSADELGWLQALDRQHRALCSQEFATAAAETVVSPLPELQRLVDLYAALAERHRDGEIAPDPARHGLGLLDWVRLYPYPILIGPEIGELEPPLVELGRGLENVRRLPLNLGGRVDDQARDLPLTVAPQSRNYFKTYALAMLHPTNHGGWPFRHPIVCTPAPRQQLIQDLDAAIAHGESPIWLLRQLVELPRLLHIPGDQKAMERAAQACVEATQHSPMFGYKGLCFLYHAHNIHQLQNVRMPLRQAFRSAQLQLTPKPSPFLDQLQANDAWVSFSLPPSDDNHFENQFDRVLVALRHQRSIEAFEDEIRTLPETAPLHQRRALITEYIDRYRGWCTYNDMQLMGRVVGSGQASGVLLSSAPAIWRAADRQMYRNCHQWPLRDFLWPTQRDFDLNAMTAGLAAIDWTSATPAVDALYQTTGNLITTLLLADTCAEHGHAELGERYREQVQQYFQAVNHHVRVADWNDRWRSRVAWLELMVYSSSPATAEAAITAGREYFDRRTSSTSWTASWLSLAQAHLVLEHYAEAADALANSFVDEESKDLKEPFVWPGGILIRGEPQQRLELLRRLAASGALEPLRGRIIAKAKAAMVPAEFAELLGVNPDALGQEAAAPGLNDF